MEHAFCSRYRQHLSFDEVKELSAPDAIAIETVKDFLVTYGARDIQLLPTGDFMSAKLSAKAISMMLECGQFWEFAHARTTYVRTDFVVHLFSVLLVC